MKKVKGKSIMSKLKGMIPILDAGHGGVINGVYQTAGKRSPDWDKGVLYEGMFNRWVMNRVMEDLDRCNIPYLTTTTSLEDTPLKVRVRNTNSYHKQNPSAYLISIHANAGGGTGFEVFTSIGKSTSDIIAQNFFDNFSKLDIMKMREDRSDGDSDKEAQLYLLRKTTCPAVLLELGFMDNKQDYDKLWDKDYLEAVSNMIVETIISLR